MAITKFYKVLQPEKGPVNMGDNQDIGGSGGGLYTNYTWYHVLLAGSPQRLIRYREYDVMDNDIDVARALDIIAEEMAGNNPKTEMPLEIKITAGQEQNVKSSTVVTLKAALKTWCALHDWGGKVFSISRNVVKYGDCFFLRPKRKFNKLLHVHAKNVVAAAVTLNDITRIKGWQIKIDTRQFGATALGSAYMGVIGNTSTTALQNGVIEVNDEDLIRFTLYDDMSEEAPFGVSVLRPVYKTFKQKELLEDALLIYRIQRAPEKRVYRIEVGQTPAHMVATHLEKIRSEIKQKRIPSIHGGGDQIESMYNPMSMSEDLWFAMRKGEGSTVDVLPGGQNLGELQDLDYFYNKMFRGFRIPASYVGRDTQSDGVANDGRVGIAYIQEIKFTLYIERLQRALERTFDAEFKRFLREANINVDPTIFTVVLPEPSNYRKSREQSIDADLLNNLSSASGMDFLSKRFALIKYGQFSMEEVKMNERMKKEELGLDPDDEEDNLPVVYSPDQAELGGFDGGLGGSSGSLGGGGGLPPPDRDAEDAPPDDEGVDDTDTTEEGGDEESATPETPDDEGPIT